MTFKKRIYIGIIASSVFAVLSFVFKDFNELHILFNILLGGVITYLLLFYLFQSGIFKSNWTNQTDKIIGLISGIGILIFGVNMANRIDNHQDNFWMVNGNVWLADVLGALIALLIFYFIFSWIFGQWKNIQALKNEKTKAELALLKTQINPHFFFNTLNNLYSLIKKDPDIAQEYVLKLSDMMRFTIYDGKEETVTFIEEVKYLANFIELQTARYHKKMDINFKYDIKNNDCPIPPLLFIVLLENSFKHGVEKLVDQAYIYVELSEDENSITFEIKNNFDPDTLPQKEGIGLINLRHRLNLLYPENKHILKITTLDNTFSVLLKLHKL